MFRSGQPIFSGKYSLCDNQYDDWIVCYIVESNESVIVMIIIININRIFVFIRFDCRNNKRNLFENVWVIISFTLLVNFSNCNHLKYNAINKNIFK